VIALELRAKTATGLGKVTILLTQNRLTNKIQFQAIRYGNVMTGLPEIDSQFGSIGNKSRNDFSQGARRTRA
jgi:hypothetical protein